MNILLHPTYFPSVAHFVAMVQAGQITFEIQDNFQKQTYRNRMYIYSPSGKQLLNIPIKHSRNTLHQKYKDVQIDYSENWQRIHFKSLEMAYRSSPFFEYFEDDIRPLFEKKHDFLLDYNFELLAVLQSCLGLNLKYETTTTYLQAPVDITDLRCLVDGKKTKKQFESYTQVFDQKHGFLSDLSILDLLFNEGRYAVDYLKNQSLKRE